MRTIVNKNQVLTKFYVAVLYKWHPFIPQENIEISEEVKENIIKEGTSVKKLFFSSSSVSDLIEFAEYKFKFKVDGERKEYLLNDFLDSVSRDLVGSQFRDLQKIEHSIVPQLSGLTRNWDETVNGYFGGVSLDNTRISLVDVPENIWKIEIYKEDQEEFIEYSIKKLFNLEIKEEPLLTIELGPDPVGNISMNDEEMYYIYPEIEIIKENKNKIYYSLLQEIYDRKVFYIVQTPNNLSAVNISLASWNSAKVPHRNKKYWNVTNDYFNGKVQEDRSSFDTDCQNTLMDVNSMTLLGNVERGIPPILDEKIQRSQFQNTLHTFKNTVVYNKNEEVYFYGKKYRSLVDGNIWESPSFSGTWMIIPEKGQTILEKIQNNKKYISLSVLSDGGNVFPCGNISAKISGSSWSKSFTIEEPLGYSFKSILINESYELGKKDLEDYLTKTDNKYLFLFYQYIIFNKIKEKYNAETNIKNIQFKFEKFIPILNINFVVSKDYYNNKGKEKIYKNEFPEGISIKLNGNLLSNIYGSGINLEYINEYEIEVICDNRHYILPGETIFKGKVDENIINLNVHVDPREYKCTFDGSGLTTVNGDSSRICYYKQSCEIEFYFDDIYQASTNWEMREKRVFINGSNINNTPFLVQLSGGGDSEKIEILENNNNYILIISEIDRDFNIKINPKEGEEG